MSVKDPKIYNYYNDKDIKDIVADKFYVKMWLELIESARTINRQGKDALPLDWTKPFPKAVLQVAEILNEIFGT